MFDEFLEDYKYNWKMADKQYMEERYREILENSTHKFFSTVPFRQDLHCQNLRMILTIPCSSSYLGIASTNHPTLSQVRSSIELPLTNLLPSIAVLQEIAF